MMVALSRYVFHKKYCSIYTTAVHCQMAMLPSLFIYCGDGMLSQIADCWLPKLPWVTLLMWHCGTGHTVGKLRFGNNVDCCSGLANYTRLTQLPRMPLLSTTREDDCFYDDVTFVPNDSQWNFQWMKKIVEIVMIGQKVEDNKSWQLAQQRGCLLAGLNFSSVSFSFAFKLIQFFRGGFMKLCRC